MTTSLHDPTEADGGTTSAPPTTVSRIVATPVQPHNLRTLGGITRSDMLDVGGAALSAISITFLLFGLLTPLKGVVGEIIVAFVIFVIAYATLVSLHENRPAVVSKVMTVLLGAATFIAFAALFTVVAYTLYKGWEVLRRPNFYTQDMSETGPLDPLSQGGIKHAIAGTLIIISLASLFTVPLGLVCAVFINETKSRLAGTVRTVVDAMTALPSIVAGLFIFALAILILGWPRSGLAAAIAMGVMMLPIIIRSADVVLRIVPGNLREASAALGAPLWRTVWHVVLPTARSGLATAVILGIARGVGETAPVLLVSGSTAAFNANPTKNPMQSLPLATYEFVRSPQETLKTRGFGAAAVLMMLVLGLFVLARIVGGRGAGQLSRRQTRRRSAQSARDLVRMEAQVEEVPA